MSNTPPPPGFIPPPPPGSNPPPPPGFSPPPGSNPPPPAGYQAYQPGAASVGATPANFGQRAIAYLIDVALVIPILIVGGILFAVSDVLGLIVMILGTLAYVIYNLYYLQGTTGQSIGKKQQQIKLVRDSDGQPVGGGMAFLRYLLAGAISNFTCGIYGLLDYLWPLWDNDKKRLTDKILKFAVVQA